MRSNLAVLETERNRRASQGLTQLELLRREGLRRLGTMTRGFRYVDANGRVVSQKERERIEAREHVKREGDTGLVKKHVIKKSMVAAVREASEHLGNTPAVARASYIYPSVLALFERGHVVDRYFKSVDELAAHAGGGMHCSEKALLHMLGRSKELVKQGAL
ncbi:hypothetical protein OV208_37205 [Corallococcus sp. bb12-1]|uniref:hypothetical protein n=1 Tax=Corallococcus sp. bb12-1 TaxID=2996784 RepID=UPI00226FC474|nr:hypothetical protein [Corallococcus sp. bb12-1]MCY1047001.1 hypothetical protein [Corallococcus sp. bb12-1]